MRRLTFENSRGETIIFYLSPLLISSLTGIAETDIINQDQQAPYQDGTTHVDTKLQPRYPTLEGTITFTDLVTIKEYRKQILRVCNPKLGLGRLAIELDGDRKEIDGVIDSISFPDRGNSPYQEFVIAWKCPDPYWRDPQEVSRALKAYEGRFNLPFTLPLELGVSGDSTTLKNDGDVDCPITIDIQGPVMNPQVRNLTTNEFIRFNRSLSSDEVLHINTDDHNKRVEVYRNGSVIEKAWGYIEDDSTFFNLIVGDNELEYVADSGVADAIVAIAWQKRYMGV